MGLGEIINRLENCSDLDVVVKKGWGKPMSYRGYYEDLAFAPAENVTLRSMLEAARSALGSTFTGYKGGEYEMGEYTDCWIAEYGDVSDDKIGDFLLDFLLSSANKSNQQAEE